MTIPVPQTNQDESLYYEHYRRGVIQRHICANGRFLEDVLLVEQDPTLPPPHASFHANRRRSEELIASDHSPYELSAYPVVVEDSELRDARWTDPPHFVVGGSDNPLLHGGLAMAALALEELLEVSDHSFDYAVRLLNFFIKSEMIDANGDAVGFPLRRRQWWHSTKEVSKDELCGMLLGLHFFMKAAAKRDDATQLQRAYNYLARMGRYLRRWDYSPAGAWLFQFPFTRIFKFNIGISYLSGKTFPDDWGPLDELAEAALAVTSLFSLDFDLSYKPKDLYRDIVEWQPDIYHAAAAHGKDTNFYNVTMLVHTLLMIHDNPVKQEEREVLWPAFHKLFRFFADPGSSPAAGEGDGKLNAYLGLVIRAFAQKVGHDSSVRQRCKEMYHPVLHPRGFWQHDLALCSLGSRAGIPKARELVNYVPTSIGIAPRLLWGDHFTWENADTQGHTLDWSWAKTLRQIGTTDDHLDLLRDHVVQGVYYHADLSKGYRVEASGMDFVFCRILAAYLGFADPPQLVDDVALEVLPINGPPPVGGFLGNTHKKEVHDYAHRTHLCQVFEIKPSHKRWYRTVQEAKDDGFDNCAYCIGNSKR